MKKLQVELISNIGNGLLMGEKGFLECGYNKDILVYFPHLNRLEIIDIKDIRPLGYKDIM